jgi:isoquinoline 1-oxidoreductase alpha subunit
MPAYNLIVNDDHTSVEVAEGTALLWVLREHLGLTGTKYGCGIAQCGACTIHVDGKPTRACILSVEQAAKGQQITTIEGLSPSGGHRLQAAWVEAQVPQCGYCQSGQIMQAAALLRNNANPTREEIKTYMNGNLCRCGTYLRIIKAIEIAAKSTEEKKNSS